MARIKKAGSPQKGSKEAVKQTAKLAAKAKRGAKAKSATKARKGAKAKLAAKARRGAKAKSVTKSQVARGTAQPKRKTAARAVTRARRGAQLGTIELSYNAALAAQGFQVVETRLRKIAKGAVEIPNVDIPAVITRLIEIAARLQQPAERARFAAMPELDVFYVDNLVHVAWSLWYARVEYLAAGAKASKALLPASITEPATEIRGRMLRVLEYHFAHEQEVMAELASIRQGTSELDLSTDLSRLARLYNQRAATLVHDKAHYRETDEALAIALAQKITKKLRSTKGATAKWAEMQARAWTFVCMAYNEVAAAGRYLYRHDEPMTKFPVLDAMQQIARPRRRSRRDPEPTTSTELTELLEA